MCKCSAGCIQGRELPDQWSILLPQTKTCTLLKLFFFLSNDCVSLRIESRWGRDFWHPSRPALGLTQPPVQWIPGKVDHPPPSSTEVKERVQLYLYSPSGPSWPVVG
jgi:hypothetical protein